MAKQVEIVPRPRQPNEREKQIVKVWNLSRLFLTVTVAGGYLVHAAHIV